MSNSNRTASRSNRRYARHVFAFIIAAACALTGLQSCSAKGDRNNQKETAHSADDSIIDLRLRQIRDGSFSRRPIGERVVAAGRLFIGTPYVGGTLESGDTSENLVLTMQGLDCVTFYENALSLARTASDPSRQLLAKEITRMRYRSGVLDGYASRLHYTTDYFNDAERKGILRNVTREVGGRRAILRRDPVDFMSTHRSLYKALASDASFTKIQDAETQLAAAGGYYYIPKDEVASIEGAIQNGDILGIVTSIAGLDCSHTGIAVKDAAGHVRFMHASSAEKKVVEGEESLSEYLARNAKQIGVIVMRPIEPTLRDR